MTAGAKHGLDIVIVGAGLAGLTTAIALLTEDGAAHRVTVLEKYANCQPTFSGPVQIHTNATRVLATYGVTEAIEARTAEMKSVQNIHRYSDGHLLYSLPAAVSQKNYKSPIWNISRSELLGILLSRVEELGGKCRFSTGVADVDTDAEKPVLTMQNGETISCELVIAADGINSMIRRKIVGQVDPVCPLTSYCITADREKLKADPELEFLIQRSGFWVGPKQSVVGMDLPSGCNFMLCDETSDGVEGVWDKRFDVAEVKRKFATVDPRLHKVLDLAGDECFIWKLSDIPELETWRSKSGKIVLTGDAAHAMIPFAAQGAGTSIEDAACLAACVTGVADVAKATAAFEAIRKPRTTFIAQAGRLNLQFAHMENGPIQEARDAALEKMRDEEANRTAPPPEPAEGPAPQSLADFAPPETVTNLFTPLARKYVLSYNVFDHTNAYLKSIS